MLAPKLDGYKLTIYFNDNTSLIIQRNKKDTTPVPENYLTGATIEESIYTKNKNPVGVVNSGICKINLTSLDRSLIPTNKNSKYYGLMNNTAEVEIEVYIPNKDGSDTVNFGRFYVTNWSSNVSSSSKYSVTIEGTDILGILIKNDVPALEIKQNIKLVDLMQDIRNKLAVNLSSKYNFDFEFISTPKYNSLSNDDIEADDVGDFFNIICQNTLCNFFVDRETDASNKKIKILDLTSNIGNPVDTLSDTVEVTYASISKGAIVSYTGCKVNYSIYNVNETSLITTLNNYSLVPGVNVLNDINLGGNIFKINNIIVQTNSGEEIEIQSIKYNKRTMQITLNNNTQENIVSNIIIYGQTWNENELSVTKLSGQDSNEILEVKNNILPIESIDRYALDLLNLIESRGESVVLKGIFNPAYIHLNDIIHVDCSNSIYTSDDLRVVGLKWRLADNLTCEATLVK